MPTHWNYADLPTLGHVALLWAERHGLSLPTGDPSQAQRALEIALDAMPYALRVGAYGWPMTRRNWCKATGQSDPRANFRHAKRRDVWTHWLATQGVARGDVLNEQEAAELEVALPDNAELYLPLLTPYRRAWRWKNTLGIVKPPGYAFLLQRMRDGRFLVDTVRTLSWRRPNPMRYSREELAARAARMAPLRRAARARLSAGQKPGQYLPTRPHTCPRQR